jgi:hypothetical protein
MDAICGAGGPVIDNGEVSLNNFNPIDKHADKSKSKSPMRLLFPTPGLRSSLF